MLNFNSLSVSPSVLCDFVKLLKLFHSERNLCEILSVASSTQEAIMRGRHNEDENAILLLLLCKIEIEIP